MSLRKLFYCFSFLLVSFLVSCSDENNEPVLQNEYEVDYYTTSVLQRPWKITEHEYAGYSYYTKDFETSWVINRGIRTNEAEFYPFSYKLPLQKSIHYVPGVEVRIYPDSKEPVICDAATNERIFHIEECNSGGNYYIMIIRDLEGNRFRCESRDNACMFCVTNASSYETLSISYKALISQYDERKEIDYTVESLPRNVTGAYAILVEDDMYSVEYEVEAPDGAKKLQTSSGLYAPGTINGDITDEGFVSGGDESPEESPYDEEAERLLENVFVSENSSDGCFIIYKNIDGAGYRYSQCLDGRYIYSTSGVRVLNGEDGNKWIVMAGSANGRICQLVDYDSESLTVASPDYPQKTMKLRRQSDCLVHFYKNKTSYESCRIDVTKIVLGSSQQLDLPQWNIPQLRQNDEGIFAFPVPGGLTQNVAIEAKGYAYNATDPENGVEFTIKSSRSSGSNTIARTVIEDSDLPHEPTKEEIDRLEAFLWKSNTAMTWRIMEYAEKEEDEYKPLSNGHYYWLITERNIDMEQGIHFGHNNTNSHDIDENCYITYENGVLLIETWKGEKKFEILNSIPDILSTGVMELYFYDTKLKIRCIPSKKPLLVYAALGTSGLTLDGTITVKKYDIKVKNKYGRIVEERSLIGTNPFISRSKTKGAWALISDEVINPDEGLSFDISAKTEDKRGKIHVSSIENRSHGLHKIELPYCL
ncbi:MAG: hypothetical protein J6B92_11215 [Paraprevotella sp.]|nr:hypothetical protein [Paraprevotella sp.]MBP3472439.1 hypothetical protein [Paraprevotella sp.]